jgi:hypothetical protein
LKFFAARCRSARGLFDREGRGHLVLGDLQQEINMAKFVVLYRSSVSAKEQMSKATPEQAKAGMAAWASWAKTAGPALVEMGTPFGDTAVLKGTAPQQGHIGGYSIIQAESLDTAKKLFEGHPHFEAPGASIELLEQLAMPGA